MAAPMRRAAFKSMKSVFNFPAVCTVHGRLPPLRWQHSVAPTTATVSSKPVTWATERLGGFMKFYEDFIGISEIRNAQAKVMQAETQFIEAQALRREKQRELEHIQFRLKEIHAEMDKVSRGEDRFYDLFNKEHAIVKEEKLLVRDIMDIERDERGFFSLLSTAIRETHEKERIHSERTKYWPIVGSFITFLLASAYGVYRFQKLQTILSEASDSPQVSALLTEVESTMRGQHNQLQTFVADLKKMLGSSSLRPQIIDVTKQRDMDSDATLQLLSQIKMQDERLAEEMEVVKGLVSSGTVRDGDSVVYVGPDMRELLNDTQARLELKIKANALFTVVCVYAGLAVTVPLLYTIFKGG